MRPLACGRSPITEALITEAPLVIADCYQTRAGAQHVTVEAHMSHVSSGLLLYR